MVPNNFVQEKRLWPFNAKEYKHKLDIRICLITNSRCSDFWPELTSHHFLSLVDWGDSELCCVLL